MQTSKAACSAPCSFTAIGQGLKGVWKHIFDLKQMLWQAEDKRLPSPTLWMGGSGGQRRKRLVGLIKNAEHTLSIIQSIFKQMGQCCSAYVM